uniref:Uncharacterized protein n=1 Tax=Oryza sativa subsp. japonica TaxID=39947 RepID=Q6YSU2_ORYSJ|nr:hypothetical protein [Oryza sativa Japonica Group]
MPPPAAAAAGPPVPGFRGGEAPATAAPFTGQPPAAGSERESRGEGATTSHLAATSRLPSAADSHLPPLPPLGCPSPAAARPTLPGSSGGEGAAAAASSADHRQRERSRRTPLL